MAFVSSPHPLHIARSRTRHCASCTPTRRLNISQRADARQDDTYAEGVHLAPHQQPTSSSSPSRTAAPIPPPVTSRRGALNILAFSLVSAAAVGATYPRVANAKASAQQTLAKTTAPVVMCRRLMGPVAKYIDAGQWDKGRTNVNYCTRILAMRKNMRAAADLLEGDAYYDALDIMGDMENVMSQLDASLYTPLFIPSDEGIAPEQQIYQTQARAFYEQAVSGFERFLSLLPSDVLDMSIGIANGTKYEIDIERDASYSG